MANSIAGLHHKHSLFEVDISNINNISHSTSASELALLNLSSQTELSPDKLKNAIDQLMLIISGYRERQVKLRADN
jgi:hypothetical protein